MSSTVERRLREEAAPVSSTEPASDSLLVEAARTGDEQAFRILVERYESRVAATVVGMLGPGDDAEDVGQETFIRLYRSLDRFRGESALGTYLTRIAINLSLTALKKRKRQISRFVNQDDVDRPLPEASRDPRGDLERAEESRRVREAIQRLSPDHRAVVVLRMIDGYTTRETSEILDIPTGTVMSRLARAMDRLEREMKESRDG